MTKNTNTIQRKRFYPRLDFQTTHMWIQREKLYRDNWKKRSKLYNSITNCRLVWTLLVWISPLQLLFGPPLPLPLILMLPYKAGPAWPAGT